MSWDVGYSMRYYEPKRHPRLRGPSQMNCRIAFAFLTSLALAPTLHIVAQNAPGALPQDPMALMTLAHDKNGLVGSEIKPWHIRGTYRSFDTKGKPEYEGTYEEWWVNATNYKLSFTNPKSTQKDFATGAVLLRVLNSCCAPAFSIPYPTFRNSRNSHCSNGPRPLANPTSNVSASHIPSVPCFKF
jgi:hypothetical protein